MEVSGSAGLRGILALVFVLLLIVGIVYAIREYTRPANVIPHSTPAFVLSPLA